MTILSACSAARADAPATQPHVLPADAAAPIITLDQSGGMMLHKNPDPVFQVLADGAAIVGNPYGFGRVVKGKLSAEQVQDLLRYILDDQKFAAITPADLRLQGGVMVTDAQTTTISVDADGTPHRAGGPAINVVATQAGPDSPAEHFQNVEKKIEAIERLVILGGDDGLKKYLELANNKLKSDLPGESPMHAGDLATARALADGSTEIGFRHKAVAADGKWHLTDAEVTDDGKDNIKVTVARGADQPAR